MSIVKKMSSLLIALVLMFALAVPAFAEDGIMPLKEPCPVCSSGRLFERTELINSEVIARNECHHTEKPNYYLSVDITYEDTYQTLLVCNSCGLSASLGTYTRQRVVCMA